MPITVYIEEVPMKGRIIGEHGDILIDSEVIKSYAGQCAVECFGIVGMAAYSVKDGLVKLLKKSSLTHGVHLTICEDQTLDLDFHCIVSYGVSLNAVTDNLMETVRYKLEEFTGMKVGKIRVFVEGVRVID